MKILIFIFISGLSLLCFNNVHAQEVKVGVYAGGGTYQMSDMKTIQDEVLEQQAIPNSRVIDSFSPFYNFGLNISVVKFPYEYGGLFRYESTGGRIGYSDITGSFFFDQIAEQYLLGFSGRIFLAGSEQNFNSPILPFLELRAGGSLANVTFEQIFSVNNDTQKSNESFHEESFFLEPVFGARFTKGSFALEPSLSAFIDIDPFKSGLHLKDEPEAKLKNEDGIVNLNWLGLRAGINLTVVL